MPHNLEVIDGEAQMFYVKADSRDIPWHGLGVAVSEQLTAHDAMVAAGLEWEVQKCQAHAYYNKTILHPDGRQEIQVVEIELPDTFGNVRDRDGKVLGVVSGKYEVYQPSECFSFMDEVVKDGEAGYDTAGSLKEGRHIFLSMKLPKTIMVGGIDAVDCYLLLNNSYDGSRALTSVVSPIRAVCDNTVTMAICHAKSSWTIRHDSKLRGKVQEAREALGLTYKYFDAFEEEANKLLDQPYTMDDFEILVEKILPTGGDEQHANRPKQLALIGNFQTSDTIADEFRFTKWGCWNALSEYIDWFANTRATKTQSAQERRFTESQFGSGAGLRDKAFAILSGKN